MIPLLLIAIATIIGLVALILIPTNPRSFKEHRPMQQDYGLERRRMSQLQTERREL